VPEPAVPAAEAVEATAAPRLDQTSEELSFQDVEVEPEARLSADQLEAAARALAPSHVSETPPRGTAPLAAEAAASRPAPRPAAPDPWSRTEPSVTLSRLPGVRKRGWVFGVVAAVVVCGGLGLGLGIVGPWRTTPRVATPPALPPLGPRPPPPAALPPAVAQPVPAPAALAVADAGAAAPAAASAVDAAVVAAAAGPPDAAAPTIPTPPVPSAPLVEPGPPDHDPRSTRDLIKLARLQVRRRNWDAAQQVFEKVVRREPDNLDAVLGLALVAVSERRFDDAVAAFQRATTLKPDSAVLHVYLGNAFIMRGDHDEAEREWRRALEIDPRQREARSRLQGGGGATKRAPRRGAGGRHLTKNPYR
jgi:hypothetical protein